MKSPISALKAFFLILMLGSAHAVWAAPAGQVLNLKGKATATDAAGKTRSLKNKSTINAGDHLQTNIGSVISMSMKDGGLLALSGDTSLAVRTYAYMEADGTPDQVKLHLNNGSMRSITGKVTKNKFLLTTPYSEIRPLGTEIGVKIVGGYTIVVLLSGGGDQVAVTNPATGEVTTMTTQGQILVIAADGTSKFMTEAELQEEILEPAGESMEDITGQTIDDGQIVEAGDVTIEAPIIVESP
jgi:ferric-dicitrate binding protein FerR (iron transport regulator)